MRVFQISDTHLLPEDGSILRGVDVDAGLKAVLADLSARMGETDLVLHTGDLIQKVDGLPAASGLRAYRRLASRLSVLERPVYCLPGNHDASRDVRSGAIDGEVLRWRRHLVRRGWQIFMLDSSVPGSPGGRLAEADLDLLDGTLSANREHALLCMHHSPVPIGSAWLDTMVVENAAELFVVLDRHPHVRALAFGHVHQDFESSHGDVALLGCPSTSLQFAPGTPEPVIDLDALPGYRLLDLREDGEVTSRVVRAPE